MDISRSQLTKDGRPAGTPHFTSEETLMTEKRHSFVLTKDELFYSGKKILDVGCGYGSGPKYMITHGAKEVTAIDFNLAAIDIAKEHFSDASIRYVHGVFPSAVFGYGPFDVITALEFVEHVTDVELLEFLLYAKIALKDDGFLYVTTPKRRLPKNCYPQGSHWTEYGFDELVGIFEQHGFVLEWSASPKETDGISMALLFCNKER